MQAAKLIVEDATGTPTTHSLTQSQTLIGRSGSCDLQLTDRSASREHAAISWEDDHYIVEDLQTTNGTKVNGKRVRSAVLQDGDEIRLGQTTLTFRLLP